MLLQAERIGLFFFSYSSSSYSFHFPFLFSFHLITFPLPPISPVPVIVIILHARAGLSVYMVRVSLTWYVQQLCVLQLCLSSRIYIRILRYVGVHGKKYMYVYMCMYV